MSNLTDSPSSNKTLLIALGVGCAFAFAPLMYYHLLGLWAEEYYQYFPFVIAAVAWFMWDRWNQAEPTTDSWFRRLLFWTMLLGGSLLLAAATLIWSPWLASFAFVLTMGAAALEVYRSHGRLTNQFGIWCLLWLLVPIPLQFDQRFVVLLQRVSAILSGHVLDLIGIDHLMLGTVLELPQKQFFVDEACSGIVSVMSVIASGAIYVVWRNRTLPHALLLLAFGIGWAVVMNIGRITTIAIAHAWWGTDLSTGWQHDALGLVLFSMTFIALVSTDQLLGFANDPIELKAADREQMRNPLVTWWNYLVTAMDPKKSIVLATPAGAVAVETVAGDGVASPATPDREPTSASQERAVALNPRFLVTMTSLAVLLGGLQLFVLSRGYRDPESPVQLAMALDTNLLPDEVGAWEKTAYEAVERESGNEFGNYSKQFTYRHRQTEQIALLSLDFPYRGGWHELSVCYRNFGWPMLDRQITEQPIGDGPRAGESWTVVTADYEKPEGRYGYLAFSGTNGSAECLEPPSALVLWRPWFRLRRRLLHRMSPRFFQFQAWMESDAEITTEAKDSVKSLFLQLRPLVLKRLGEGPSG